MSNRTAHSTPPVAPSRRQRPLLWVALVGTLALVGGVVYPELRNSRIYRNGEAAYQAGDCETAIAQFTRLQDLNAEKYLTQSMPLREECEGFLKIGAEQAAAGPSATLVSYSQFLTNYPETALRETVRQQTTSLFQQHSPKTLADEKVCASMTALVNQNLMADPTTQAPSLHFACGKQDEAQKDYAGALQHYNSVLNDYPNAAEARDAEAAIARTLVAQANETGAGKIPPPQPLGSSGNSSSIVKIRNSSPKVLRIVFSGPEPQFAELPPCPDCQVYSAPTRSCPQKGAEGTYTLKPGQYSVLVRAADDSSVTPFTGDWSMQRGKAYSSCFYLVRRRV
jgi:tetratricopeptide (TPR) repeat protein